ncbi:MAG: type 1 periplasmic-binding domain-containing protein [Mycobacteriales bacterium]
MRAVGTRRWRGRTALAGGVVTALLVAACGSTAPLAARQGAGGLAGGSGVGAPAGGLGTGGASAPGGLPGAGGAISAAPGAASASGGTAAGGVGPASGAGEGAVGNGAGAGSVGSGGQPVTGSGAPGVTATTIEIGLPYANNAGAVNAAAGAGNLNPGNEQQDWQVLVDYLNAHGGIDGRRVVPVWYGFNADSSETTQQIEQAMCAAFTQDNHVFAVLTQADQTLAHCILASGAVMVGEDLALEESSFFTQYPYYVEPGGLALDRIVRAEIPQLVAEGYFGAHPKIGILTYDQPSFSQTVDQVMIPELASYGYRNPLVEESYYPTGSSGIGEESASISSAELKFRSSGVDHVLFLEQAADLALFFMNDAASQDYHPRYGVNSQDGAETLASGGDVPASQIVGAEGIGWLPVIDLASYTPSGPYGNAAARRCVALMQAGGVSVSGPDSEGVLFLDCDMAFFLQAALDAGGSTINRANFLAAVNGMGSRFTDAQTIATSFSPSQHDGVSEVYDYVYQSGCGCLNYTGPPRSVG